MLITLDNVHIHISESYNINKQFFVFELKVFHSPLSRFWQWQWQRSSGPYSLRICLKH